MFSKKADTKTQIDEAITEVHTQMSTLTADDPAYASMADQLIKLYGIKDAQSKITISLKDWLPVIGSVGSVLTIVTFEAAGHTVLSKALSFVPKNRS